MLLSVIAETFVPGLRTLFKTSLISLYLSGCIYCQMFAQKILDFRTKPARVRKLCRSTVNQAKIFQ